MRSVIILGLLISLQAQAIPLRSLRQQHFNQDKLSLLDQSSLKRVDHLIQILNPVSTISPVTSRSNFNNADDQYSSKIMRKMLKPAILALKNDAEFGVPMVFDPSDYSHNIEAKRLQNNFKVCDNALSKISYQVPSKKTTVTSSHYDALINSYLNSKRIRNAESANKSSNKLDINSPFYISLISFINNLEAQDDSKTKISKLLGKITSIDIVDGGLRKIRFSQTDGTKISLTLDSLVSIRTSQDNYFIDAHKCLLQHVETRLKENRVIYFVSETIDKKDMEEMRTNLVNDIAGAEQLNDILSQMSQIQVNNLIYLFIALDKNNIPSSLDLKHLQGILENQKSDEAAKTSMSFDKYRELHETLNTLEEYLILEKETRNSTKEVVNEILQKASQ